jgi:hypothetical protein
MEEFGEAVSGQGTWQRAAEQPRSARVKLLDWAHDLRSAVGLEPEEGPIAVERRREPRRDVLGHKVIVRQRKALGILHLKNLSSKGGCGLTDMPLAVGSLVFLELRKPHFWAAEVRWARSLTVGLEFFRPVRPEMFEKLHGPPPPDSSAQPKARKPKRQRDS